MKTFEIFSNNVKRNNLGMATNFSNLSIFVNVLFVISFRQKCFGRLLRMIKSFQSLQKDTNKPTELKMCERIFDTRKTRKDTRGLQNTKFK